MSFKTAASIPVVYTTAYLSLIDVARLQNGETVLIHAAAGGVGQAAIMLSIMIGAETFVTVGTLERRSSLWICTEFPKTIYFPVEIQLLDKESSESREEKVLTWCSTVFLESCYKKLGIA